MRRSTRGRENKLEGPAGGRLQHRPGRGSRVGSSGAHEAQGAAQEAGSPLISIIHRVRPPQSTQVPHCRQPSGGRSAEHGQQQAAAAQSAAQAPAGAGGRRGAVTGTSRSLAERPMPRTRTWHLEQAGVPLGGVAILHGRQAAAGAHIAFHHHIAPTPTTLHSHQAHETGRTPAAQPGATTGS